FSMARTGMINAQPLTPLQPIVSVAQPSCIVATGTLSVASSLIGLTFSNDGINYNNTTGIFNGIPAGGFYSITAKNVSGCVSATTIGNVNVQPITPTAPLVGTLTQPSCALATGSVILSGLPAGSWTINPGAINGSTSTTNISALVSGGHLYTVTNSMGCTSVSSANVQINVQPVTPLAPVALAANGLMGNRFTANWNAVSGAIAYAIDVSLNNTFTSFVAGYNNLVVGANLTSIISGLSNGSIYYYRVRASNATCTSVNSNVITANTLGLPTLTTSVISSITFNTASSGGNIISDGGSSVTARGICWNTIGTPTIADNITSNATGIGAFSSNLSGLTAGTTYVVRAYATNSVGTSYGNQISFNTPSGVGIIVSNNNDAGAGSLRYALSNVTSGGTITFTSVIDGQTINLLTGTLTIDKNVILDNSNHITGITVSGSSDNIIINAGRTLTLASGSKLTITGAIRNNAGASGLVISSGVSFIQNNVDLPATAQRVLNNGWHLFGSPFKKSMSAMLSSITPTGSSTQLLPYSNGTG
ncbi:MAG: beta strand repeat-containing protein, partial [Ferruginibacter sp.]